MIAILALLLGVACASHIAQHSWDHEFTTSMWKEVNPRQLFEDWAAFYDKKYVSLEDEAYRYGLWIAKTDDIIAVNNNGDLTYKFRHNQFSDLTAEEFQRYINGGDQPCLQVPPLEQLVQPDDTYYEPVEAPASVDWRTSGDVTPVKNQGQCGSCWAFATNGALECDSAVKKGKLYSLSEQQLVDCTKSYGNNGCGGGWWYNAFDYVKKEGGLCTESEYKYTARDGSCKDSSCGTKYDPISAKVKVTPDSDTALGAAVATGCVSVGVDAAFGHYSSGVFSGNCGTSINHGVTAVGYGTSGSQQYWIVKNSWGTSWGMSGYILICRNCNKNGSKGECGINMYPYYVTPQ